MLQAQLIIVVCGLLLFVGFPSAARAATQMDTGAILFGIEGGSTLVTINPLTGATAPIGPIGFAPVSGLAVAPSGVLFATHADPRQPGPQLLQIDPATGAGTAVGAVDYQLGSISALAFSPPGVLYGVGFQGDLVTIDPATGLVTLVGPTGLIPPAHVDAIAVDPVGQLLGVTSDPGDPTRGIPPGPSQLIIINPLTGLATTVGPLAPQAVVSGIAFFSEDTLLGVTCDISPRVVKIDPATGSVTDMSALAGPVTCVGDLAVVVQPVLGVEIDIKPGEVPNAINLKSSGLTPVAVLSAVAFDAMTVDPVSVRFGPAQAQVVDNGVHSKDINGDGRLDLVLAFKTQDTGITCGTTTATLTGTTGAGQAITGSDAIKTVGC